MIVLDCGGLLKSFSRDLRHPLVSWSGKTVAHSCRCFDEAYRGRITNDGSDDPHSDTYIAATKIFRMIDNYIEEEITDQRFSLNTSLQAERRKRNSQLENSLEITINAYKAQWHPLVPRGQEQNGKLVEEVIRNNWRAARREMLKVINRASYRSVLALYLFSQTPVPIGVSDEEEGDGVSGLVCIQTALLQIQRLRERQKGGQFYGSGTLAWTETLAGSMSGSHLSRAYLDLENRAYWATVIWDTSSSLTSNLRASLTSGLKGACSEPVWRLTRSFLTGSFHHKTEAWRTKGFEVSDDTASQVISAAAICTLYIWKNITSLKEALREGVDEESVLFTWTALQDAIDIFKSSIRPLLTLCERQLHFLGQDLRFIWYQVHLQYCLGILIMADAIEGARRSDLLSEVREAVQDAENEAFDVLKSGTDSDFKIDLPGEPLSTITASLVAMDPNPHYVLDLVSLLNKSIISKHRRGEIKPPIYSYLHSILYKALDQLPRYSKSVSGARDSLQRAFGREKQFPSSGTTV